MNLWIDTSPENGNVVRSVNWNLYSDRLSADCRYVLYVCCYLLYTSSASGRIIGAKDHASIQINIAEVSVEVVWTPDPSGRARKGLGKTLPGSVLSTGMLPLVLMRERMPHQPTSVR